ncbi:S8 family peptidase [Bacillus sp. BRMEA1]|uniref:S8 family peptidase n=1 Tax=Neobacillus endophyticus TaxID=2738405 RepID=UPI0015664717|nr:S8 family peptidase [Neobacillus endophyticus]NRD80265.1 S8 family peptidase [Neobacillus endophyticus]
MKKLFSLVVLMLFLLPSICEAKVIALGSVSYGMPVPQHQSLDWGITDTNVQKWWRQGYTGRNVKIAVIDTGVDYYHPDLKGAIAGGVSFIKGENYWTDYNGHGTGVIGEIAAQNNHIGSVGVAYNAKIYAVKAMDRNGSGTLSHLILAVNWCIIHKMNIINMSLGLSNDETKSPLFKILERVINQAYAHGILIVAASGNDGINQVDYPANFKNVIAVGGAYEAYNAQTGKTSIGWTDFSNYSNKIEVIAPSAFVYSTYPMNLMPVFNDYRGYEHMIGTSMAAPYVAGFLALLKQKYPRDTPVQLRNLLHINTIPVSPRANTGYGFLYAK